MSDLQVRGPLYGGSGSPSPFTATTSGAQRVADAHARYMQAVFEGRAFTACSQALATLQTGLTTAQTGLGIYNPSTSGKNLVLWSASCVFTVAQATAAAVYGLCANTSTQQAAPTGQTAATTRNCLLGSGNAPTAVALTAGTLAAAPVAVSVLGVAMLGATSVSTLVSPFSRDYAGQLIIGPGAYLGYFASVAPTATSFWGELIWEEIPALP